MKLVFLSSLFLSVFFSQTAAIEQSVVRTMIVDSGRMLQVAQVAMRVLRQ
jgi:hypothetical protein